MSISAVCACASHGRASRGLLLDDAVAEGASEAPYWAELWPSARALAAHLGGFDLHGLRAMRLGCGLALPSVAAALGGADVLAVDHDAEAVRIARLNGRRTGRRVRGLVADLREPPTELLDADAFDLVLAADVLYDASLAEALGWLIPRFWRRARSRWSRSRGEVRPTGSHTGSRCPAWASGSAARRARAAARPDGRTARGAQPGIQARCECNEVIG